LAIIRRTISTAFSPVVFITHDFIEALKLGDRIAIMGDGEIVQVGTAEEIAAHPADEYVSEFVKDVPRGKVVAVESIMEQPQVLVGSAQSLEVAIDGMRVKRVTLASVVDADGRLKGIVTMEQAITAARNGLTRTEEAAQRGFPFTSPNTPVEQCLRLVTEGNVPVAVLDEEQRLLGVVTRPALIHAMYSGNKPGDKN